MDCSSSEDRRETRDKRKITNQTNKLMVFSFDSLFFVCPVFLLLLSSEEPNSSDKSASLKAAICQKITRLNIVDYFQWIIPVSDVIKATSESQIHSEDSEAPFGMQIQ